MQMLTYTTTDYRLVFIHVNSIAALQAAMKDRNTCTDIHLNSGIYLTVQADILNVKAAYDAAMMDYYADLKWVNTP